MKVLIVCSANSGKVAPFIVEQVDSLASLGVESEYFLVQQKGILGYLKLRKALIQKIISYQPDIIHAHYGLSGLLANLQRKIPVVTTYLGSDINYAKVFFFSKIAMLLSAHNIFVSEKNRVKSNLRKTDSLVPFGVITELFVPLDQTEARTVLKLDIRKKYVLFAGNFLNPVKNFTLAQAAVELLSEVELMSLGKGYTREEVVQLMNAVDVALMTSYSEGSPQFIKEVMACNCPIVSVDVGDVAEITDGVDGCYISSYDAKDAASKIQMALDFGKRTDGRKRIVELKLDIISIANKIFDIYKMVLKS